MLTVATSVVATEANDFDAAKALIDAIAEPSPSETGECQGHEDGYYHSSTATDNGRAGCDRCGLLRPRPSPKETPDD